MSESVPPSPPPDIAKLPPAHAAPVFYKINCHRVRFAEYLRGKRSFQRILNVLIIKLFRLYVSTSSDDPCVESLAPFEVEELPEAAAAQFAPMMTAMSELGFGSPIFHDIDDILHHTHILTASLSHPTLPAIARIRNRIWSIRNPPKNVIWNEFITPLNDGTFLWSTGAAADWFAPKVCRINRRLGAGSADLWASHLTELKKLQAAGNVQPQRDLNVRELSARLHATVRDYYLKRGLLVPLTSADAARSVRLAEMRQSTAAAGLRHFEILAELARLEEKKTNWLASLTMLAISILAFWRIGNIGWSGSELAIVVGVLFFHETGHYVAMRVFGYRNVRMFFIPMFGAAVTGKHYNVAGWKKAIVFFMGPVPGICVGVVLGLCGMVLHKALLLKCAGLLLILNGFNLIPVLPLDGGWVMHILLFSRHYLLDAIFRILAVVALVAYGASSGNKILLYLGIALAIGIPRSIKIARIVSDLRKTGLPDVPPDDQKIPESTAQIIIDRVKQAFPKGLNNQLIAQTTLQVFETLNAKPPGWLGTLLLSSAQVIALGVAIAFGLLFLVAQRPDFASLLRRYQLAATKLSVEQIKQVGSVEPALETQPRITVVANYPTRAKGETAWTAVTDGLPANAKAELFGDAVLISLPASQQSDRIATLQILSAGAKDTFVDGAFVKASLLLQFSAPNDPAAGSIIKTLQRFFVAPGQYNLIPPWTPIDPRSPDQRARDELARDTFEQLNGTGSAFYQSTEWKRLTWQILDAQKTGDESEAARLRSVLRQKQADSVKHEVQLLLDAGPEQADHALVVRYLEIEASSSATQPDLKDNFARRARELAPLMGQLSPDARRFHIDSGYATRKDLDLTVHVSGFADLQEGTTDIVRWLAAEHCTNFRYRLTGVPQGDLDGLDDP